MAGVVASAAGFEQEPRASLRFVDPVLDEACGRNVAVLIYHAVHLAQAAGQSLVILAQRRQHVERVYIVRVVVLAGRSWTMICIQTSPVEAAALARACRP
jgi:hypothetical protein